MQGGSWRRLDTVPVLFDYCLCVEQLLPPPPTPSHHFLHRPPSFRFRPPFIHHSSTFGTSCPLLFHLPFILSSSRKPCPSVQLPSTSRPPYVHHPSTFRPLHLDTNLPSPATTQPDPLIPWPDTLVSTDFSDEPQLSPRPSPHQPN